MRRNETIILHGRFQPFHLGHVWLLEHLIESTDNDILIGIINPDPWDIWSSDDPNFHRFTPSRNPLTYWDRYYCIKLYLQAHNHLNRILGIVPMPRPSINLNKCKRFMPQNNYRFVISIRQGDETEWWKKEKYESLDLRLIIIDDKDIPVETKLITGTMIRDLMAVQDDTWMKLVPPETKNYLSQKYIQDRILNLVNYDDAHNRIKHYANNNLNYKWCERFLKNYMVKDKTSAKNYHHDITGAIAESLFWLFPPLKGLLRLRDAERRWLREEEIIKIIQEQGKSVRTEVEKILVKYNFKNKLLENTNFIEAYPNQFQEIVKTQKNSENLKPQVNSSLEEDYLNSLCKLYGSNLEDFWLLVSSHSFDPAYIKGTTPRAKLRSFLELLSTLSPDKIKAILRAIHKEHQDITVFKEAYILSQNISITIDGESK